MEISMNEVFLYRVYMHVLYNDFLIILIIGMNLASHHSGSFFFFVNVIDHGNLGELQP